MAPPPETADFRNERRRIFLDMVSTRFVMGHGAEQIAAGNVPDCGVTKYAQAGLAHVPRSEERSGTESRFA